MNGKITTVKELVEFLKTMPEDALVYRSETINEIPNASYLLVLNVWEENGHVMLD